MRATRWALALTLSSIAKSVVWSDDLLPPNLNKLRSLMNTWAKEDINYAQIRKALGVNRRNNHTTIVLGVFSKVEPRHKRNRDIREIARGSWMQHPNVCFLEKHMNDTEGCRVYVTFVVGNDHMGGQNMLERVPDSEGASWLPFERGVLELPTTDRNWNQKSFAWFRYASRRWPWADYIGKADETVFVHVQNVLAGAADASADNCTRAYLGRPWACTEKDCPPTDCGPALGHNALPGHNATGFPNRPDCWTYMQGGMYLLNQQLALNLTKTGEAFENKNMQEELGVARAAQNYLDQIEGDCLYIWNRSQVFMNRAYHHADRDVGDFPKGVSDEWNDFYGESSYEWHRFYE